MKHTKNIMAAGVLLAAAGAWASHTYTVAELGENGWISGDTRTGGTLSFVTGPTTPPYGEGSVRLETNNTAAAKTTLDLRDDLGSLASFTAEYAWFRTAGQPAVAPALKLGIDTANPNPTSPTAVLRGEDRFDKILVFEPYLNPLGRTISSNVWTTETITQAAGKFWIVDLDGATAPGYGQGGPYKTLGQWLADPAYGAVLSAGEIKSIQLGVGSNNPGFDGNVDYIAYSLDDGAHVADFEFIEDSDGDGIRDDQDACPDSDSSETLIIGGCDTGVENFFFEDGCTLSDVIAELQAGSDNHGAFVSAVAHLTNELKADGTISGKEKGAIQRCAAQSN